MSAKKQREWRTRRESQRAAARSLATLYKDRVNIGKREQKQTVIERFTRMTVLVPFPIPRVLLQMFGGEKDGN